MGLELFGTRATTFTGERDGAATAVLVRRERHSLRSGGGVKLSKRGRERESVCVCVCRKCLEDKAA